MHQVYTRNHRNTTGNRRSCILLKSLRECVVFPFCGFTMWHPSNNLGSLATFDGIKKTAWVTDGILCHCHPCTSATLHAQPTNYFHQTGNSNRVTCCAVCLASIVAESATLALIVRARSRSGAERPKQKSPSWHTGPIKQYAVRKSSG